VHLHHRREGPCLLREPLGDHDGGKNQGGREGNPGANVGCPEEEGQTCAQASAEAASSFHSACGIYGIYGIIR
jgi:hypothetical protein